MKSNEQQSQLYQFVRDRIRQELSFSDPPTFLEEELICRLTVLVYTSCDREVIPLEDQIQMVLRKQEAMIHHTLLNKRKDLIL